MIVKATSRPSGRLVAITEGKSMVAFQKGFADGLLQKRNDRVRTYETDKAEKSYWEGYIEGMRKANPSMILVRCERDGKIFAIPSLEVEKIVCPACGRGYIKEGQEFHSDRKLTIL